MDTNASCACEYCLAVSLQFVRPHLILVLRARCKPCQLPLSPPPPSYQLIKLLTSQDAQHATSGMDLNKDDENDSYPQPHPSSAASASGARGVCGAAPPTRDPTSEAHVRQARFWEVGVWVLGKIGVGGGGEVDWEVHALGMIGFVSLLMMQHRYRPDMRVLKVTL